MDHGTLQDRPLFILGHHRSGTSLLTHLLDGHPSLVVNPHESYFFSGFLPFYQRAARKGRVEDLLCESLMRVWNSEHPYYRKYLDHIPVEELWEAFWRWLEKDTAPRSYLSASLLAYAEASQQDLQEASYWVEKTPNNEHYAERIFEYWPKARCVHVIRDPRDLHATLKKRAPFPLAPRTAVHNWRRSYARCKRNSERYGRERYISLHYEDLVSDPKGTLEEIHAFLGIGAAPSEEGPTLGGGVKDWHGNPIEGGFEGISTASVGQWEADAKKAPGEYRLIEAMLEDEMKAAGYLDPEKPPETGVRWKCFQQELLLKLKEGRQWFRRIGGRKEPVY